MSRRWPVYSLKHSAQRRVAIAHVDREVSLFCASCRVLSALCAAPVRCAPCPVPSSRCAVVLCLARVLCLVLSAMFAVPRAPCPVPRAPCPRHAVCCGVVSRGVCFMPSIHADGSLQGTAWLSVHTPHMPLTFAIQKHTLNTHSAIHFLPPSPRRTQEHNGVSFFVDEVRRHGQQRCNTTIELSNAPSPPIRSSSLANPMRSTLLLYRSALPFSLSPVQFSSQASLPYIKGATVDFTKAMVGKAFNVIGACVGVGVCVHQPKAHRREENRVYEQQAHRPFPPSPCRRRQTTPM